MDAYSPARPPREPIFTLPAIVTASVLALVAIHAVRAVALPAVDDLRVLLELALVPARWTVAWSPERADEVLRAAASGSGPEALGRLTFARFIVTNAELKPWTLLTYAALHGSWAHVILNGVWLAAFGTPVARRCGVLPYLVIAALSAMAGGAVYLVLHPLGISPLIGASAALSGLTAAAARFVFSSPHPFRDFAAIEPRARPVQRLPELLRNRQAALFIGIWFTTNILFGVAATPLGVTDAGIAWEAHIGGFAMGLLIFPLVDPWRPVRRGRSR